MSVEVTPSSGNVFADLDIPDAGEHQLKAWIVTHFSRRMKTEKLAQTQAAERMGLKQPDLSAVRHGRFKGYSVERLARCLSALGDEVRVTVRGRDGAEGSYDGKWVMTV